MLSNEAFKHCALNELDLSRTSISSIGSRCFAWNEKLSRVVLPSALEFMDSHAFAHCVGLVSIDMGACDKLLIIPNGCLKFCGSLKFIKMPPKLVEIEKEAFCGATLLPVIVRPRTVKIVGDRSFASTRSLLSIIVRGKSMPLFCGFSLMDSSAIVVCHPFENISIAEADNYSLMAVPNARVERPFNMWTQILCRRLCGSRDFRRQRRLSMKTAGRYPPNIEYTWERRDRKLFSDLPDLPIEIWFYIFGMASRTVISPSSKTTYYLPNLRAYKPSLRVWTNVLRDPIMAGEESYLPPLMQYLLDVPYATLKKWMNHLSSDNQVFQLTFSSTAYRVAMLIYERICGPYPDSMWIRNRSCQLEVVESLRSQDRLEQQLQVLACYYFGAENAIEVSNYISQNL